MGPDRTMRDHTGPYCNIWYHITIQYQQIIQGNVFGPMFCSKTLDGIGKECLENGKYTYKYKDIVEIPPLIMLDDLITISECGHKTAMVNSYVKFKTSSKKLQFGNQKCKKIHVAICGRNINAKICT